MERERTYRMTNLYLRIFASQNADIGNDRIFSDIFAVERILSPIQIQVTTTNNRGLHEVLPDEFNGAEFNARPVIDEVLREINNRPHVEGPSVASLLDYNPDGLARDGSVISVYYLAGENDLNARSRVSPTNDNNNPILGSIFIPSDLNDNRNRFILAHEIVHILFSRITETVIGHDWFGNDIIERGLELTNPGPSLEGDPTHSSQEQNLMFRLVPSSESFVQTEVLPENLFSEIQRQKAEDSPLVFD